MAKELVLKPATIGGVRFDDVFRKDVQGITSPCILVSSVAKWLVDFSEDEIAAVIAEEPWLERFYGRLNDERVGLTPIAIALVCYHLPRPLSSKQKESLAEMMFGWVRERAKAAKAWP